MLLERGRLSGRLRGGGQRLPGFHRERHWQRHIAREQRRAKRVAPGTRRGSELVVRLAKDSRRRRFVGVGGVGSGSGRGSRQAVRRVHLRQPLPLLAVSVRARATVPISRFGRLARE